MSYDLRLGVKVEGCKDLYAVIDEPELSSPTYNLGEMFRACMDWDFEQGEWYCVANVLPNIEQGIHELTFNSKEYKQYNSPNGWGTVSSALNSLKSLLECIQRNTDGSSWSWNQVPLNALYVSW